MKIIIKINNYFILFFLFFLYSFQDVKRDYVIFDLKTYKNISDYPDEYENVFYENVYNILYSEISLGQNKEKIIMEIKAESFLFSIFNYNCEIPPINKSAISYLPTFANSSIIYYQNRFPIYGEYFTYILENNIYIKTNKGEKNAKINYMFSPRNDSNYTQNLILRPYSCFKLGFEIPFIRPNTDIDSINDFALNLVFQFKRANITSSYKWFIEYDNKDNLAGKLILGVDPHEYNPKKYNEINSKITKPIKRIDNNFYWDIQVNEIYLKNNNSTDLILDKEINLYLTCSLEVSLGVIFGTSGYKNYINDFFSKEKMCHNANPLILNKYIIYYCKKDIKENLKANFSSLVFNHRYLNKSFELNFDDLFLEKGEYIYFLVFFDRYDMENWKFGKPFLSKYFFSYDLDGRTITFYDNGKEKDDENSNILVLIIVIIILFLIFIVIGFFVGKYIYSYKKRKKGTELNERDDYNYESINNNG